MSKTLLEYLRGSYIDEYGGSILFTFIGVSIIGFFLLKIFIAHNKDYYLNNWERERCNPLILPVSGYINKPPGKTEFESTYDNFYGCTNSILNSVSHTFIGPFIALAHTMQGSMENIDGIVGLMRERLAGVTDNLHNVIKNLFGSLSSALLPIYKSLIKVKDMFMKFQGVMAVMVYSIYTAYLGIITGLKTTANMMKTVMYALVAVMIPLLAFPPTWAVAAPLLAIFGSMAAVTGVMYHHLADVAGLPRFKIPKTPKRKRRCFDGNVELLLHNGRIKKMCDIEVGDKLFASGKVTAKFDVYRDNEEMFMLDNVVVTGNHSVWRSTQWISVAEHEEARKLENYEAEKIYCINTESKCITINERIFSDWDDLEEFEVKTMARNTGIMDLSKHKKDMHKMLQGGFDGEVVLKMNNGKIKFLKDIENGDLLEGNNRVVSTVRMDKSDFQETNIESSAYISNNLVGEISCYGVLMFNNGENIEKLTPMINGRLSNSNSFNEDEDKYIYHLVTEQDKFLISGLEVCDFDRYLEHLM